MTDKLTAAEIERLRQKVHDRELPTWYDIERLCDMASASLPSAGDGEVEELAEQGRRHADKYLRKTHGFGLVHDMADTLARQQAEIASLRDHNKWLLTIFDTICNQLDCRQDSDAAGGAIDNLQSTVASLQERLTKAEAEVCQLDAELTDERQARKDAERHAAEAERRAEARVAELTRVVEAKDKVFSKIIKYPRSYKGRTVSWGIEYAFDALKSIAKTGLSVAPLEALTAVQGEERRRFEFKEAPPGLVMGPCAARGEEPAPNSTQGPEKCDSGEVVTPTAAIREAMGALEDCANDLAALVEHQYRDTLGYPAMKRKYLRDMEPVQSARAAHAKLTEIIGE